MYLQYLPEAVKQTSVWLLCEVGLGSVFNPPVRRQAALAHTRECEPCLVDVGPELCELTSSFLLGAGTEMMYSMWPRVSETWVTWDP